MDQTLGCVEGDKWANGRGCKTSRITAATLKRVSKPIAIGNGLSRVLRHAMGSRKRRNKSSGKESLFRRNFGELKKKEVKSLKVCP